MKGNTKLEKIILATGLRLRKMQEGLSHYTLKAFSIVIDIWLCWVHLSGLKKVAWTQHWTAG